MERLYPIFCGDESADEVMSAIAEIDAEVNELFIKRAEYTVLLKEKLKKLNDYANELVAKLNFKDIYSMTEQELLEHCKKKGLSEEECRIAKLVIIDRLKGKDLYSAMSYSERQSKRLRTAIINKIKEKL
jgi:hypothetical protein